MLHGKLSKSSYQVCFVLVRVIVDLESIPGRLGMEQEYSPWMGHQSITAVAGLHIKLESR